MKLIDVNLLLYAVDAASPQHERARRWLESLLSGTETVGLPWAVLLAFVRLATRGVVFTDPLTPDEALDVVDGWLAQPSVVVLHPTDRHPALLRELLHPVGTAGNLTTDAHLAALAIEYGATLCSADADFSRFPGLRWLDPLRS
ncbi:MAG: type II toxin-antitoxin system VapC family toxin [Actinomycetes bacterium]